MRVAKAIELSDDERVTLTKWSRGRSTPARLVLRAKIVLAAATGRENKDIATELGCTRRTVGTWRNRFAVERLAGIRQDAPRPGRPASTRAEFEAEIIRRTSRGAGPPFGRWCRLRIESVDEGGDRIAAAYASWLSCRCHCVSVWPIGPHLILGPMTETRARRRAE